MTKKEKDNKFLKTIWLKLYIEDRLFIYMNDSKQLINNHLDWVFKEVKEELNNEYKIVYPSSDLIFEMM